MKSRARGVNCKIKQRIWHRVKDGPDYYKYVTVFINTHRGLSIWSLFKTYFNKLEINETFTRVDLLNAVYVPDTAIAIRQCQTTVDQYRRAVVLGLCMERVGWGVYKKIRNIPSDLTITKLRKHVYSKNWKSWFITIDEI
jgi:hypothetical protein